MNVLGLMGSHRTDGNTNDLLETVLASAQTRGAKTEKVVLIEQRIGLIQNCRACTEAGRCVNDGDAMQGVMEKIYAADVVVMATPVYYYTISSCLKTFIDRTSCYYYWKADELGGVDKRYEDFRRRIAGRAAAMVCVQEEDGYSRASHCLGALERCFEFYGWENLGYVLATGGSRGTTRSNPNAVREAQELGVKLADWRPGR